MERVHLGWRSDGGSFADGTLFVLLQPFVYAASVVGVATFELFDNVTFIEDVHADTAGLRLLFGIIFGSPFYRWNFCNLLSG